jgi:hypothetical protein
MRNALLDSPAESVEWTSTRVSRPTKYQSPCATGSDHLIVNDIRREAAKRKIASSLPNDFVRGSETDEMCETLDDNHIAVMHKPAYGFSHG